MKTILNHEQMRREIMASHQRSELYGVCREERSIDQKKLTPGELEARRTLSRDLLDVILEYIDEFYEMLSPDIFGIAVADNEGYILHFSGSDDIKSVFADRNCSPGYRWTERDVGTSAISLCLEKQVPIQLNDKDHYCKRAHGFTSSAAPIFGRGGFLNGVLVVSGENTLVHPHTLIMVTSAARSIEKQIRLLRRNKELSIYTGFLDNVIESAETGLLTLDSEFRIWKTNLKARKILRQDSLDGKPLSVLPGFDLDLDDICKHPNSWKGRVCHIRHKRQTIDLMFSAQPVLSSQNKLLGVVVVFEEFGNIRKLADKISGIKPFFTFEHLIGSSPPFLRALELAKKASQSDSTVLLLGETGTGKELFAQAIHNAGRSRNEPFIPVNCGAIPGELIESELFGYVDGAFTGALKGGRPGKFELADRGTIMLDEIGDMPHNMQVKLLRVLQTGEVQRIGALSPMKVKPRVIASTNVVLTDAIAQNRFRQDLYYRLNILQITIPPLRERGSEDIRKLAEYFIQKNRPECSLTAEAVDVLTSYDWPGNARELENTIQRALHTCDSRKLEPVHLGLPDKSAGSSSPFTGSIRDMEHKLIASMLAKTHSNMAEAAKRLGISRATLYRKVKEYRITAAQTGSFSPDHSLDG